MKEKFAFLTHSKVCSFVLVHTVHVLLYIVYEKEERPVFSCYVMVVKTTAE